MATTTENPPLPSMPQLEEHEPCKSALANFNRLQADLTAANKHIADLQARRAAALNDRDRRIEALVAGREAEDVDDATEAEEAAMYRKRRDLEAALHIASNQLSTARAKTKAELLRTHPYFSEVVRPLARRAALALLNAMKAVDEYGKIADELNAGDMAPGYSITNPWGSVSDETSWANALLGLFVDEKLLDLSRDREALSCTHPQLVQPYTPPPAPKPKPPAKSWKETMRGLGVPV